MNEQITFMELSKLLDEKFNSIKDDLNNVVKNVDSISASILEFKADMLLSEAIFDEIENNLKNIEEKIVLFKDKLN